MGSKYNEGVNLAVDDSGAVGFTGAWFFSLVFGDPNNSQGPNTPRPRIENLPPNSENGGNYSGGQYVFASDFIEITEPGLSSFFINPNTGNPDSRVIFGGNFYANQKWGTVVKHVGSNPGQRWLGFFRQNLYGFVLIDTNGNAYAKHVDCILITKLAEGIFIAASSANGTYEALRSIYADKIIINFGGGVTENGFFKFNKITSLAPVFLEDQESVKTGSNRYVLEIENSDIAGDIIISDQCNVAASFIRNCNFRGQVINVDTPANVIVPENNRTEVPTYITEVFDGVTVPILIPRTSDLIVPPTTIGGLAKGKKVSIATQPSAGQIITQTINDVYDQPRNKKIVQYNGIIDAASDGIPDADNSLDVPNPYVYQSSIRKDGETILGAQKQFPFGLRPLVDTEGDGNGQNRGTGAGQFLDANGVQPDSVVQEEIVITLDNT